MATPPSAISSWKDAADDFGQKVDLTVRIREILRNYPEGLSIIKELIQNADDAGARTVKFCVSEARVKTTSSDKNNTLLNSLMNGPSLLAYNSAEFTETDFQSIQRIGDSLKKATGTKTGRFGVGVNSTYHLTDVPMFVSGTKVVVFDPQAKYVPGINPANPGKLIDFSSERGRQLVQSLPSLFEPLNAFGCEFVSGKPVRGTMFRFALRTLEMSETSSLSRQAHSYASILELLQDLARVAPSMLLFLKNVEKIEIYKWKSSSLEPTLIHTTCLVAPVSDMLRKRRAYMLHASSKPEKPIAVDYIMEIVSKGSGVGETGAGCMPLERWVVCNQLGGGRASLLAKDPSLAHMNLVPWAGVAARVHPVPTNTDEEGQFNGAAYCFLPLPVFTKLPVHVNGFFELSSNRRDVWWGEDMAGDGRNRAEWNKSLISDIAAICYCRLLAACIKSRNVAPETYEYLLPSSMSLVGPWEVLGNAFYSALRNLPVLFSQRKGWVAPSDCVLLEDTKDSMLTEILLQEEIPLVQLKNSKLRTALIEKKVCLQTTTPAYLRTHFSKRLPASKENAGSLENEQKKIDYAKHLLLCCLSDLNEEKYIELVGCQFIPLANGDLGILCPLPNVDVNAVSQIQNMGFTKLTCFRALRKSQGDSDRAIDWLFDHRHDSLTPFEHGADPYFACSDESASLLKDYASHTFVDLKTLEDSRLQNFFLTLNVTSTLNVVELIPDMVADVVMRVIPGSWRGVDEAPWSCEQVSGDPDRKWFVSLWIFICKHCSNFLFTLAEQYCIVPTNEGFVCNLSPGSSVIDAAILSTEMKDALISLGVRTLLSNLIPSTIKVPNNLWNYIHSSNRDGVVRALETSLRRHTGKIHLFENAPDGVKMNLYRYLANSSNGSISVASYKVMRTFPIFRSYTENGTIQFVPLNDSKWYALDFSFEPHLITSKFLTYDNISDLSFLNEIGVQSLNRKEYYRQFLIPSLPKLNKNVLAEAVEHILVDSPMLCSKDKEFRSFVMNSNIIPTAISQSLKKASELFDPEIHQLKFLMDDDCFPLENLWKVDLLLAMRSFGLQSSLTWDVLITCAKSIDEKGKSPSEKVKVNAKASGKALLLFLDQNFVTYFPELTKTESKKSSLFQLMNAVLFEDPEKKKIDAEEQAKRTALLLSLEWVPVLSTPPHPLLPWLDPFKSSPVASPITTIDRENMWLLSATHRIIDGRIHNEELRALFGWSNTASIKDIAIQLQSLSAKFNLLLAASKNFEEQPGDSMVIDEKSFCRTVTSQIPRLYNKLDKARTNYERDIVKSALFGCKWLWIGEKFISSEKAAFSSSINAAPYLYTVPQDLLVFDNLLKTFGVSNSFGTSDFCSVLHQIKTDAGTSCQLTPSQVELAINIVQIISDDVMKLSNMEIYAPSVDGKIFLATTMIFDDAPWLSKNLPGGNGTVFTHPKISNAVAEKIGAKSFRGTLLDKNKDLDFGVGVLHESFSQTESITRRLKSIVEMYPEGPQQLFELIQNADDANATIVRFLISKKQFGTSSLFGKDMSEWQGPSLLVYNDATFEQRDFDNISRIGQASKLEKLTTTGRFGLGFNSVYHWTDVPSFISGSKLVIFDPHKRYLPAGADGSRGIKIHFSDSNLAETFADQMKPFCYFGCNGHDFFPGTMFRFPFRNDYTASQSEISKVQAAQGDAIDLLITGFKKTMAKALLFLRNVKKIEMYCEGEKESDNPELLYSAEVCSRTKVVGEVDTDYGLKQIQNIAYAYGMGGTPSRNDWSSISDFVAGSNAGKDSFYSKLLSTPESKLPKTQHLVSIAFYGQEEPNHGVQENLLDASSINVQEASTFDGESVEVTPACCACQMSQLPKPFQLKSIVDEYLVVAALGGGRSQIMACNPKFRHMKLLPWGGVAAHLSRNGEKAPPCRGTAFCFLPLPAETGLPVHINGYFELSSNRRDIWVGDDMTGEGKIRCEWNNSLLSDVIAPLYVHLLLLAGRLVGPGDRFNALFPLQPKNDVWRLVVKEFYREAERRPLFYSKLNAGQWVTAKEAVIVEEGVTEANTIIMHRLCEILLREGLKVTMLPRPIIDHLKQEGCNAIEATASWIRGWFKRPCQHASLAEKTDALFLLKLCSKDHFDNKNYSELVGLPFVPLCDGSLGVIGAKSLGSIPRFYVCTEMERELLCGASKFLVDVWTDDEDVNHLLTRKDFHLSTNIVSIDRTSFVSLMGTLFPEEWADLPEVRWDLSNCISTASPCSSKWIAKLWHYIVSTSDSEHERNFIETFVNSWHILPAFVGDEERTLMKITHDMAVVSPLKPLFGSGAIPDKIGDVLKLIGVRVLDVGSFPDQSREQIVKTLVDGYLQPPTGTGVLRAIRKTFPADIETGDLIRRIAIRFRNISDSGKDSLRLFLASATKEQEQVFDTDLVNTMRALPIFQVYNGNCGATAYSDIVGEVSMPPEGSDVYFLDITFVKANNREDVSFLKVLGIRRMEKSEYYEKHVCPTLGLAELHPTQEAALLTLLEDLPQISKLAGKEWIERMTEKVLLPNMCGQNIKVNQLYDPTSPSVGPLLDETMLFPHKLFCQEDVLASLRMLGLQTKPTFDGVILTASRVQSLASQNKINEAQKLGASLLNYLDDEGNLRDLVGGERMKQIIVQTSETEQIESLLVAGHNSVPPGSQLSLEPTVIDFFEGLKTIAWVPVETFQHRKSKAQPPIDKNRATVHVAAPMTARLKEEAWLSSYTTDIVSVHVRSDLLKTLLGWDSLLPPLTVATQVLALAESFDEMKNVKGFRQLLGTAVPRCYEILDTAFLDDAFSKETEKIAMLLHSCPWIWVGDGFVGATQVAFEAPDNARPYLFSVPSDLLCFSKLFKACGVKDRFLASDFIDLSHVLLDELVGKNGTPSQIDLAVGLARLLDRVPPAERATADLTKMCLPAKNGSMHKAKEMIFDDAPWLSSLISSRSVSRLTFVHADVGNDVARSCGAKSFREVISAYQNGMSTLPCPQVDSLTQLFVERNGYASGGKLSSVEDCRAFLDLVEIAEIFETKRITVMFDHRSYKCESLIHPMLAQAQGPAISICFHDTIVDVDSIVKLCSPQRYLMSSVSGEGGCFLGGQGGPRAGLGLAGVFRLTDNPQILVENSLIFLDPTGECFFDGGQRSFHSSSAGEGSEELISDDKRKNIIEQPHIKAKPTARRYQISQEFPNQFPDQLEPFFALPCGVNESFALSGGSKSLHSFGGTIFRLPLRKESQNKICDRTFQDHINIDALMQEIVNTAPSCFLFTQYLRDINILKWSPSNPIYQNVLATCLSSSPVARKNHLKDLKSNEDWRKSKSKFVKLLQSTWAPVFSSLQLQVSSRYGSGNSGGESEIVDYFFVQSVLAPSKLQAMACADALKQLKLVPALSIAAHIGREQNNSFVRFPCSQGTLCVGIPVPGEFTGLPFFLNAPLFLHELRGTILLDKDDDSSLRTRHPKMREVKIKNSSETRALALYVWNRQALSSALLCLTPALLLGVRDVLLESNKLDKRVIYRLWPQQKKLGSRYKDFLSSEFYEGLGKLQIYMTEKSGFQKAENGVFANPTHQISSVALKFFRERISMFAVPYFVAQDLELGRTLNKFNPSMARRLLKEQLNLTLSLQRNFVLLLDILEYCLSDLPAADLQTDPSSRAVIDELRELSIIPTEAGTISSFGQKMIVASPEQQTLLPGLQGKFINRRALAKLQRYFQNASFLAMVGLEQFGPRVLSNNMKSVLPPQWEGQDFVRWEPGAETPSKLWIYQFWKEVRIYDADSLQLFRRWPLIPITSGELASCSNARFILAICPDGGDNVLSRTLASEYKTMVNLLVQESKRLVLLDAAATRSESSRPAAPEGASRLTDDDWYRSEGEDEKEDSANEGESNINATGSAIHDKVDGPPLEVPIASSPAVQVDPLLNVSSVKALHDVLLKLRCPLIELSYFDSESTFRMLPPDRLTLSRFVLITLNHCLDYWIQLDSGEQRLRWSELTNDNMDDLIKLLATHLGTRLSLMASDLSLLRNIPVFASLNGDRVSLKDRDEHFTLDDSVDVDALSMYLPSQLQCKFLVEIPGLKDLLQDLGVNQLTEALVLQKYVLPNFSVLPNSQKDRVCDVILQHWGNLNSVEFIEELKKCPFVKKRLRNQSDGEIVFVKPDNLLDPRNEFLRFIFDRSPSVFPCEEFSIPEWLEILSLVGMKNAVDKDIFLKCASIVEIENDVSKGMRLMVYFVQNFGEFVCTQEFSMQLSEIKCIPAVLSNTSLALYRTKDVSIPQHRHLVFEVLPVIPDVIVPPQVMFSSLKILSPPTIPVVLKQLKELTDEKRGSLDHWSYEFGSPEDVFRSIFSFLEDNYEKLSPRIQSGLKDRAMIPVGTTLVKSSRLFFRLTRDLSPFFYEVPRAFGAYDKLLRELGVRETPRSNDYAVLLRELKREIGDNRLNANELKSVIEVISLIAEVDQSADRISIFVPDEHSTLFPMQRLFQNDAPWILQKNALNRNALHVVHPRVTQELCNQLKIPRVSTCVREHLEDGFKPCIVHQRIAGVAHIERQIKSNGVRRALQDMVPFKYQDRLNALVQMSVLPVESLQTRFTLTTASGGREDITLEPSGSVCFIEPSRIFIVLDRLPDGVKPELVIASSLCDMLGIIRQNVAGVAALLSSTVESVEGIAQTLGLLACNDGELRRGDPGAPLAEVDKSAIELRPLKTFSKGEIIAVKDDLDQLVYAVVVEGGGGSSLGRLLVLTGEGEKIVLSSKIYSFRPAASSQPESEHFAPSINGQGVFVENLETSDFEQMVTAPVDSQELLQAVQDILRSVNMSLSDKVEDIVEKNLKLQEELASKKSENEVLRDEGRELAKKISTGADAFACPITREVMEDPVICSDGHTYERIAIDQWLQSNSRSPKTNQHLTSRVLIPNHAIRQAIESMSESLACVQTFAAAYR